MKQEDSALDRGLTWDSRYDDLGDHVVLTFRLETGADRKDTAYLFARILSTSCAVRLCEETDEIRRRRGAKVVEVDDKCVVLAFPVANITGQIVDLLLASYVDLNTEIYAVLELEDLVLPSTLISAFERAPFGRRLLTSYGRPRRPLVIGVVKPSQGLAPSAHVELAVEAFRGGCDVVKDDENLLPADLENPLPERVSRLAPRIRTLREKLQRPLMYVVNIHSDVDAERYCRYLDEAGSALPPLFGALVSPMLGLPYLRLLRRATSVPLFCHSTGIGLFVSGAFRISRRAYIKLLRLTGIDALIHAPPFANGWQCSPELAAQLRTWCAEPMHDLPEILLTFGGGLGPTNYKHIRRILGTSEFGYLVGGSIFAHPRGPAAGAKSLNEAIDEAESRNYQ